MVRYRSSGWYGSLYNVPVTMSLGLSLCSSVRNARTASVDAMTIVEASRSYSDDGNSIFALIYCVPVQEEGPRKLCQCSDCVCSRVDVRSKVGELGGVTRQERQHGVNGMTRLQGTTRKKPQKIIRINKTNGLDIIRRREENIFCQR